MRDITSAFLETVPWFVLLWVVGSAIHFFYPNVLFYYIPPAVLWVIAMGVHAYVSDEDQSESMAYTADELE